MSIKQAPPLIHLHLLKKNIFSAQTISLSLASHKPLSIPHFFQEKHEAQGLETQSLLHTKIKRIHENVNATVAHQVVFLIFQDHNFHYIILFPFLVFLVVFVSSTPDCRFCKHIIEESHRSDHILVY